VRVPATAYGPRSESVYQARPILPSAPHTEPKLDPIVLHFPGEKTRIAVPSVARASAASFEEPGGAAGVHDAKWTGTARARRPWLLGVGAVAVAAAAGGLWAAFARPGDRAGSFEPSVSVETSGSGHSAPVTKIGANDPAAAPGEVALEA